MGEILYRTNSYTGRANPITTPWYALAYDTNNDDLLKILSSLSRLSASTHNQVFYDRFSTSQENIDRITAMTVEQKEALYEEFFNDFARYDSSNRFFQYACWFSTKDIVLSRANGYGKNLCRESGGVLRCFDLGYKIYNRGFDSLRIYEEEPKFSPDPLVNNKLISQRELEELLGYEEEAGRTLAPTCLKKDVLNVLKAAKNGLIGDVTPDYSVRQAAQDRIHERIMQDLL